MANRYWIGTSSFAGSWNYSTYWSTVSGGSGGASVPTSSDNVFFDSNSNDCELVNTEFGYCNNLDCTGFSGILHLGFDRSPAENTSASYLTVSGNLTLSTGMEIQSFVLDSGGFQAESGFIKIFGEINGDGGVSDGITLDTVRFILYGTHGTFQNITATDVDSSQGKTIYAPGSTLTTCTNWSTSSPPSVVHITTPQELQDMKDDPSLDYILDNDLDMTGFSFTPIGNPSDGIFTGNFDGGGFTISNLTILSATLQNGSVPGGIFSFVGIVTGGAAVSTPLIQNVNIENMTITGGLEFACLAGFIESGSVINCHVSDSSLTLDTSYSGGGGNEAGGIFGFCSGGTGAMTYIYNCSVVDLTITGFGEDSIGFFGGLIAGASASDIEQTIIEKCFVSDCSSNLDGTNSGAERGGFIGFIGAALVKDCYARGSMIMTDSASLAVGGFVGMLDRGSCLNCYTTVDIDITNGGAFSINRFGGFCGRLSRLVNTTAYIENCFCVGTITISGNINSNAVGGFLGDISGNGLVINCAWWNANYSKACGRSIGTYSGTITYSTGDRVFSSSVYYSSLQDGNLNKTPASNPTWWSAISDPGNDLEDVGYGTDEPDNTTFQTTTDHVVFAQGT